MIQLLSNDYKFIHESGRENKKAREHHPMHNCYLLKKFRQQAVSAMVLCFFCLFSSIRTVTVGSGISPDLLTFAKKNNKALAGFPGI
jgi:hypothetical protein